jgi:hypothetical protein
MVPRYILIKDADIKHLLSYARDKKIEIPVEPALIRNQLLSLFAKKKMDPYIDISPYWPPPIYENQKNLYKNYESFFEQVPATLQKIKVKKGRHFRFLFEVALQEFGIDVVLESSTTGFIDQLKKKYKDKDIVPGSQFKVRLGIKTDAFYQSELKTWAKGSITIEVAKYAIRRTSVFLY